MREHFTQTDIEQLEQRMRARLINSLSGFKSVNLIGTQNLEGETNLSIVSSVFHLGASPALMGMIIRPDVVPRDTLSNIKALGEFTINHVSTDFWHQAHQTSARYESSVSEFEQVGLNAEYIEGVSAPFVQESRVKLALTLREINTLNINGTILVIGEVKHILLPSDSLKEDGYVDIEAAGTVSVSGLDCYHDTNRLGRLAYAKVDQATKSLCINGNTEGSEDG